MKSTVNNPFIIDEIAQTQAATPTIPSVMSVTYSQCYEDAIIDGIIRTHCKLRGYAENSIADRFAYLEIGANHPIAASSTYYLKKKYGMTGMLVEANPDLILDLVRIRTGDTVLNRAVVTSNDETVTFYISHHSEISSLDKNFVQQWEGGTVGVAKQITVSTIRPNQLLELMPHDRLWIVSIDVEGYDYEILTAMDLSEYRPAVMQLEPSDHYRPGSSDQMIKFMRSHGYRLAGMTDVNLIFFDSRLED